MQHQSPVDKNRMLVSSIQPAVRIDGRPLPDAAPSSQPIPAPAPSIPGPPSSRAFFAGLPWHLRAKKLARNVIHGLYVHHAFDHAAAMAFYFFLGIIPLLVSCGMIIGRLVRNEGSDAFIAPLYRVMPPIAADLVRGELVDIAQASTAATSVAPITLLVFLWLTSNGFHNLMDVFELLTTAQRRTWRRKRIIAVGWVLAIFTVVAVATWVLLRVDLLLAMIDRGDWLPSVLRRLQLMLEERWRRQGIVLVFSTISVGGLATFYRYAIVHPRGVKRHVWTGTFVALLLWGLASWGFSAYVKTLAHYALYYGGVATMATTLLWLYLTSLALVIGAEINAQLEGIRAPKQD